MMPFLISQKLYLQSIMGKNMLSVGSHRMHMCYKSRGVSGSVFPVFFFFFFFFFFFVFSLFLGN